MSLDSSFADQIALNYARGAYFALGLNLGLLAHGVVSSLRVFKRKKEWPFIICIWALVANFISTLLSYGSAYWADPTTNASSILTTFDGNFV